MPSRYIAWADKAITDIVIMLQAHGPSLRGVDRGSGYQPAGGQECQGPIGRYTHPPHTPPHPPTHAPLLIAMYPNDPVPVCSSV